MQQQQFRTAGCPSRGAALVAMALIVVSCLSSGEAAAAAPKRQAPKPWRGPETDFQQRDGQIYGPWWQGGGVGVVYFTGPYAQKHEGYEEVGRAIAEKMGLPYIEIHKEDLLPSDNDANGVLVYPDGTTRVQLCIMPGGNSYKTMADIAGVTDPKAERAKFDEYRKVPQAAFRTGMNYVGCCGGFFTATSGYLVPNALSTGWALWPGKVKNIGPVGRRPFPDVVFDSADKKHPLFRATKDGTLKEMFYNGGPIGVEPDVPDTEYFGKYAGGAMTELVGDWFCVAYRPATDGLCGRCVIATGHPEVAHPDFLMAMAQYAVYHDYVVPRKDVEPGKTVEAVVGDDQMQYYCVKVDEGKKLTAKLTGMDENCDLYVRFGLPPSFRKSDAKGTRPKKTDETITVARTKVGDYFLGVHGKHDVLNGVKYTLTVTVE